MSVLASDCMDRARAFLNDIGVDLYTNTILLPFLKIANDEFADALANNSIPVFRAVGTDISITAGTTNSVLTLPNDFIEPLQLFEKSSNDSDDLFSEMYQKDFEENTTAKSSFIYWAWRNQTLIVPPVDNARKIRLR